MFMDMYTVWNLALLLDFFSIGRYLYLVTNFFFFVLIECLSNIVTETSKVINRVGS